jgi:hypothetical protein
MANEVLGARRPTPDARHSVIDCIVFDRRDAGGRSTPEQLPIIEAPQSFLKAHFEVVWVYRLNFFAY